MAARAHVAHPGLRGFLHYVTELASEREAALALHERRFGGKHFTADFGPGEAGGEADFVFLLGEEIAELDDAEVIVNIRGCDFEREALIGDDLARHFAANVRDFAIEVPDASFMRVVAEYLG